MQNTNEMGRKSLLSLRSSLFNRAHSRDTMTDSDKSEGERPRDPVVYLRRAIDESEGWQREILEEAHNRTMECEGRAMTDGASAEGSQEEVRRLMNRISREMSEFHAFTTGIQVAFRRSEAFDDFDEFESWLYDNWDEYREGCHD